MIVLMYHAKELPATNKKHDKNTFVLDNIANQSRVGKTTIRLLRPILIKLFDVYVLTNKSEKMLKHDTYAPR